MRGDVQPAAPEELGPMGDVEGAELGGDDARDAEPEVAHVGRGDVDRVGRDTACAEPRHERVELLAGRAAFERSDAAPSASASAMRSGTRRAPPARFVRRTACGRRTSRSSRDRVAARCGVEAAWRPSQRYTPKPSAIALSHASPIPGRGSRADGERRARSRRSVDDRDRDRDVQEAAPVDRVESQAGRGEESPVERAQRLVVGPVEQGKREAALPREHHGVALDQLEERGQDRLAEGGGAGEPAARRVPDRARGPRLAQVDELGRQVRRRAVRERHCPRRTPSACPR